ncbi:hypothetical protein ACA910_018116 [Epithemia clementina (nom. ined.)]
MTSTIQHDNEDSSSLPSSSSAIKNRNMLTLKAFVQAQDASRYDLLNHDLVLLDLTHSNLQQRHIEIRFSRHDTLGYLKSRIHLKTGTPPHHQHLILYDGTIEIANIPPPTATTADDNDKADQLALGYFGLDHGMRVHCIDTNPMSGSANGGYEDTSLVPKYVMSEAEYDARQGTLRDWSRQQKQIKPGFSLYRHAAQQRAKSDAIRSRKAGLPLPPGFYIDSRGELEYDSDYERDQQQELQLRNDKQSTGDNPQNDFMGPESVEGIEVGMRCQVDPGRRRGVIGYVGEIPELAAKNPTQNSGYWVGVQLDEPAGRNDGYVSGTLYIPNLSSGSRYGLFVRPTKVQVGDFPERDLLEDDDEDEDDNGNVGWDSEDEL